MGLLAYGSTIRKIAYSYTECQARDELVPVFCMSQPQTRKPPVLALENSIIIDGRKRENSFAAGPSSVLKKPLKDL